MSGFYSASQYDDPFRPIRLQNFQYATNPWPGKFAICSPLKCGVTCPIGDERGWLLPGVPRNCCTSPWGDYQTSIWEQTKKCCCISMLRHPEKYKPRSLIYIANEVPCAKKFASETASEFNDPCTKEGMVEDMICGRDPSCPGQPSCPPCKPKFALTYCGDPKTIKKSLRAQRKAEKKALMTAKGKRKTKGPYPAAINLTLSCCPSVSDVPS